MRPLRCLKEVIGQEPAIKLLTKALHSRRLHHAYLFTGQEGVGKETTAKAIVYHLFCNVSQDEPCGSCPSCQKLDKGVHPDLFIVEPEKREIKIGQVRALEREMHFRPINAEYRVVIIKSAERLNPEAGNALLKSLEEPPPYVIFFLITENPSRLLPTIVSRCQVVRFRPLPKEIIKDHLMKRLSLDEEFAETLAELSAGSLGRAVELAEKGLLEDLHAFVSAGISKKASAKYRILERLARFLPEDQKKFLELLRLWVLRSYLSEKGASNYPKGLPEVRYRGDPFSAELAIALCESALESYVSPELAFHQLMIKLF